MKVNILMTLPVTVDAPNSYALFKNCPNLFAGTYGAGVYLSTNTGSSWSAVNSGPTSNYVYAFAVSGSNVFAGTYGGFHI